MQFSIYFNDFFFPREYLVVIREDIEKVVDQGCG